MKAKLIAAALTAVAATAFAQPNQSDLGDDNHDFIVASSPDSFVCRAESGRHVLSSIPCDQWQQGRHEAAAKAQSETHHGAAEFHQSHQPHQPVAVTGPSANDSLY